MNDEEKLWELMMIIERQIPRKPSKFYHEGEDRITCPNPECTDGWGTTVYFGENYCSECGQRLDWSD